MNGVTLPHDATAEEIAHAQNVRTVGDLLNDDEPVDAEVVDEGADDDEPQAEPEQAEIIYDDTDPERPFE